MTKKHFIALAEHIKANREAFSQEAINELARFCKRQNSAFMEGRWFGYIEGTNGKNGGKPRGSNKI